MLEQSPFPHNTKLPTNNKPRPCRRSLPGANPIYIRRVAFVISQHRPAAAPSAL